MSEPGKKESESKSPKKNISSCKKKPQQVGLNELSKVKGGILPRGTAYSTTSLRDKITKSINWNDSEWPELPKIDSSRGQTEPKLEEIDPSLSPSTSSALQCTISEEGGKSQDKDELREENPDEMVCSKVLHKCNHVFNTQKTLKDICQVCTEREGTPNSGSKVLEAVVSNFSALNVSNDGEQVCYNQTEMKEQTEKNRMEQTLQNHTTVQVKKSAALQRQMSSKRMKKENHPKFETHKSTCSVKGNDKIVLHDEDFPDLLCNNKTRKEIKLRLLAKEDPCIPAKNQARKYPKKSDPISINLSEVLENLSGNPKDCKIVVRSRYLSESRPSTSRVDTSRRVIKRGKQREFPKKKILSKLKLAILRGRHQKQEMKLQTYTKSFSQCENADDLRFRENLKTLHPFMQSRDFDPLEDSLKVNCEKLQENDCLSTNAMAESAAVFISKEKSEEAGMEVKWSQLLRQFVKSSPFTSEVLLAAKSAIHSRKFREYCSNDVSDVLEDKVKAFVKQIYRYQTKSHFRDVEKARIHRRYALGLREAEKFLKLRKLKVLIIATDLEVSLEKGGIDETIENIKARADKENLPVIFSLKRRDLAYCVYRKVPVSCMAVLNFEGAEEPYRAMIEAWHEASVSYETRLREKIESVSEQIQLSECCKITTSDNTSASAANTSALPNSNSELQVEKSEFQENTPTSSNSLPDDQTEITLQEGAEDVFNDLLV